MAIHAARDGKKVPHPCSRVFSARCVTPRVLFAFIHFNHKFHEQSQARPHH